MRLPSLLFPLLLLGAGAPARGGVEVAVPGSASGPVEILPLGEVVPGMKVVAYSVFQGTEIEPVAGTVQGVARNYLGPERHIIMVMFEGERIRHTGIAHGMSGSPVFARGRLVGAVSLALGPFQKDPLAGVTPIEYMVADTGTGAFGVPEGGRSTSLFAPGASGVAGRAGGTWPAGTVAGGRGGSVAGEAAMLRPLYAPLATSGLDLEVLAWFTTQLSWPGPVTLPPAGARSHQHEASPAASTSGTAVVRSSEAGDALQPGSPVSAVLIYGDATLAATGTVTWRNGDDILAFGHPFMQRGPLAIPMATAEIVATVADQTYPYKLANPGALVGTITRDQVTGVAGRVGPVPEMLPVRIVVRRGPGRTSDFSYRVANVPELTPTLLQLLLANSLRKQWNYAGESTYVVTARLRMQGGLEVPVRQAYTVTSRVAGGASLLDLVRDVAEPFSLLYRNPFRDARFESVDIEIDAGEDLRLYRIEGLHADRLRVRPGAVVTARIDLVGYREGRVHRTVVVSIPASLRAGKVRLQVVDARAAERAAAPGGRVPPDRAESLEQLVEILTRSRRGDRCYLQLLAPSPGVVVQNRRLTALPESVKSVLEASVSDPGSLDEAVVWEEELAFDGVVSGSRDVVISLLPPL